MSAEGISDVSRWRFTVDQYEQMARAGVFGRDDRVELLDGEIASMSPIGPTHASIVDRLTWLLVSRLDDRFIVRVQSPVRLPPHSEPEPDLAVLRPRDDFYSTRHPGPADVVLAIEVSDSTLALDRGVKLPIYARAALPQVWLVDVERRAVMVHRRPVDGSYAEASVLQRGKILASGPPLDLDLYVSGVLG
ncbi:MAG TPA: Uma2 family endonuclease [Euzebyales bacterium]|nr:Uma2 family endonuclease [Euzebyales bacterium]